MYAPSVTKQFMKYLPIDYFSLLQSPLIRINYITGSEFELSNPLLRKTAAKLIIDDNTLVANHLVQPWLTKN